MTARFTKIGIGGFKSYPQRTTWEFAPLTVIVGRNNSGKSALIQPLLLLKQTLADPRADIPLLLSGDLFQSRQLSDLTTYDSVKSSIKELRARSRAKLFDGISISVIWTTTIDPGDMSRWFKATPKVVAERSGLDWIGQPGSRDVEVGFLVRFRQDHSAIVIPSATLAIGGTKAQVAFVQSPKLGTHTMRWRGKAVTKAEAVRFEHFLPYVDVQGLTLGPNDFQRAYINAWLTCFEKPLRDLRLLLSNLQYLSSNREQPQEIYRPVAGAPRDLGPTGAWAADMLKTRGEDRVWYPGMNGGAEIDLKEDTLNGGLNDILARLGFNGKFSVDDAGAYGYRILYDKASLPQVGRGLSYVLPVIEAGLLADPWLGKRISKDRVRSPPLAMPLILEEPESHLHPKAQSRLAEWLVALARSHRQIVVETHSDHLVRRLRRMIAEAPAGSELETWLKNNVRIYAVEQNEGRSTLKDLRLTTDGGIGEEWPADFMDEAAEQDSAIFDAGLKKSPPGRPQTTFQDDEGPEPEVDA